MNVQVLFFGATADIAGSRCVNVEMPLESKASDIFQGIVAKYPQLHGHRLHISINQQYATGDEIVRDGDELAIFTAVSGG